MNSEKGTKESTGVLVARERAAANEEWRFPCSKRLLGFSCDADREGERSNYALLIEVTK